MSAFRFRVAEVSHEIDLLAGLKPLESDAVLAAARPRRFSAKSVMTYQGEPADYLLLLWKGRARYFYEAPSNKRLILKWITPGQTFGGAALVSGPSSYLVSTEAVRDCTVLEWNGGTIRGLARRFPQVLENAHCIAVDYVSWYVSAHVGLISQTARQRLASVIFALAKTVGQKTCSGIEIDITNEELSDSANITPYTASRLISEWQKSGLIGKARGKIILLAPDKFLGG